MNFFNVEEVFVRLGQNHKKGCLVAFNKVEAVHLFVENGHVISAVGAKAHGEAALSRALHLEDSTYGWLEDAEPVIRNLHIRIAEYCLQHAVARDIQVGSKIAATQNFPDKDVVLRRDTAQVAKPLAPPPPPKNASPLPLGYSLSSVQDPTIKFKFQKTANIIGRDASADWMIPDGRISRRHCLLILSDKECMVKDLDSLNGTMINGAPIQDGLIKDGDKLSLGGFVLHFVRENPVAQKNGLGGT